MFEDTSKRFIYVGLGKGRLSSLLAGVLGRVERKKDAKALAIEGEGRLSATFDSFCNDLLSLRAVPSSVGVVGAEVKLVPRIKRLPRARHA